MTGSTTDQAANKFHDFNLWFNSCVMSDSCSRRDSGSVCAADGAATPVRVFFCCHYHNGNKKQQLQMLSCRFVSVCLYGFWMKLVSGFLLALRLNGWSHLFSDWSLKYFFHYKFTDNIKIFMIVCFLLFVCLFSLKAPQFSIAVITEGIWAFFVPCREVACHWE